MFFRRQTQTDAVPPATDPVSRKHSRGLKFFLWGLIILVVGTLGWIIVSGTLAFRNIVATNNNDGAVTAVLHATLKPADVKTEGDSRINILLAGIGGPGHAGSDLSDTLEIYSIDPINNTVAVLSVPRDLYVTLPDGSHGRINAINTEGAQYCIKNGCAAGVDSGGAAMEGAIGKLLGININYFVRLNFKGFQQMVDALGGVDVTVPARLRDPLYPCPDPSSAFCPIDIKAGAQHFDGATALKYARSRETSSDFDRAARQQLIIAAIRDKGLRLGILANPSKITQLTGILGQNIKTDIQPTDLSTLINWVKQIDSSKTRTAVLDTSVGSPLTSDVIGGADVIVSRKGLNDFSEVQDFVDSVLKDPYVVKEAAKITLVNASGKPATGLAVEAKLKYLGYNVVGLTATPTAQTKTTITDNPNKPYTLALLKKRFGFTAVEPKTVLPDADVVLTIGSSFVLK